MKPRTKPPRDVFSEEAIRAFMDKHISETAGPSPQMRGLKERRARATAQTEPTPFEHLQTPEDRWQGRLGALLRRLRSR